MASRASSVDAREADFLRIASLEYGTPLTQQTFHVKWRATLRRCSTPNTFGRNERLRTINNAVANQRLASLEPDTRTVALLYRVAAGELEIDCVIQDVRQRIASDEFCSQSAT